MTLGGARALCLALACALSAGACPSTLDRRHTLRNADPFLVESHHGRLASGRDPLGFALPEFGSRACGEMRSPALQWGDSTQGLGALLLGGGEYRYEEGGVWASEAGALATGRKAAASFRVDGRTFAEFGGDPARASWDGESIDEQTGDVSGAADYRSYSRFRGDITLDLSFGKLTTARETAHWGPGQFGNLMLNQQALPFYQYVYSADLGPLRVTSLYGDLQPGPLQANSIENLESRSLYAHRYELRLGPDWLLAVSEQLILYDLSKPYLFAPFVPLFIAKGFLFEDFTNGNLGADIAWRSPWSTLFYGEFLLDDLESPSSLFTKDYVQNKWAALAGLHWETAADQGRIGAILEFATVEPWVYAHFVPYTAQAAHVGRPLGHPQGADARSVIGKGYFRQGAWYAGLKAGIYWKGSAASADIDAPVPRDFTMRKTRLEGDAGPEFAAEPDLAYRWKYLAGYLSARIGKAARTTAGVSASY